MEPKRYGPFRYAPRFASKPRHVPLGIGFGTSAQHLAPLGMVVVEERTNVVRVGIFLLFPPQETRQRTDAVLQLGLEQPPGPR